MSYPSYLLPTPLHKFIAIEDFILDEYLIRHTPNSDNRDLTSGKLRIECIVLQTDHLKDYSNKLFGHFTIDDIFWGVVNCERKQYLGDLWVENSEVLAPSIPDEISRFEERGYFFIPIYKIHNKQVSYEDETKVTIVGMVFHTPTNSNFWHFSIRWLINGKEMEKWPNSIKNRMKATGKAFLQEIAIFEVPKSTPIPEELYLRE